MPEVGLDGPVGLRNRTQTVASFNRDQIKILELLAQIPEARGGKKAAWEVLPLAGPDRQCPKLLADAIWDFQTFWKSKGIFHVIDGVVDPHKHTLAQLNALAAGKSLPAPQPPSGPSMDASDFGALVQAAFRAALVRWKLSAKLTGVSVNGPTAFGGKLSGPSLKPIMLEHAVGLASADRDLFEAVATVVSDAFLRWQNSAQAPGLPWYPMFAVYPGPLAPPMPNIPTLLLALTGQDDGFEFSALMSSILRQPAAIKHLDEELFVFRAAALISVNFRSFLITTTVFGVMGSGRVPSFSPPRVPAGPVVGGVANSMGMFLI